MRTVLVALAACAGLFAPALAEAGGCDPATPFELYDLADRVIIGKVTSSAEQRAHAPDKPVVVAIERALKGHAVGLATVIPERGMCAAELYAGTRALIFLDRRGAVVGGIEGYLVLPDPAAKVVGQPVADWPALVERWAKAQDDTARLDILLDLIDMPENSSGRNEASDFVVNSPRLLGMIDTPRRARIVKSLAGNRWMPNYTILILARLRAPELLDLLDERGHGWAYEQEMRALLAADRFSAVTDRAALAAAMVAKGASPAPRAAALDRCEMVRGQSLERYLMYLYDAARDADAVDWKKLAAACKR